MDKLRALVAAVLLSVSPAAAFFDYVPIRTGVVVVDAAPSGACDDTAAPIQIVRGIGATYYCTSGDTWTQHGAGSGDLLASNNLSDVANTATARSNLGAAASGANSDITSLSGLTTDLSVAQGGTGASDVATARMNLGAAAAADLTSHTGSTSNPHSVTASQVGNTTAQWNANQANGEPFASGTPSIGDVWTYGGVSWNHTTIGSSAITDGSLTADDLAAGSVGSSELAADAVTSAAIADATITYADVDMDFWAHIGMISQQSNINAMNPGTTYTDLSATAHTWLPGDICQIDQCKVSAYGDGTDSGTGTRGIRLVRTSDSAVLCTLEWTSPDAANREGSWNTVGVTINTSTEAHLQVRGMNATDDLTLNTIAVKVVCLN